MVFICRLVPDPCCPHHAFLSNFAPRIFAILLYFMHAFVPHLQSFGRQEVKEIKSEKEHDLVVQTSRDLFE